MVAAHPVRLLVVEDEIITARDLQDSLEELGYEVPDVASSGREALEMAAAFRPDLVLMDINLGADSQDGVEVAALLRDRLDLPVIYLTAYADQATLSRASATAPWAILRSPSSAANSTPRSRWRWSSASWTNNSGRVKAGTRRAFPPSVTG